MEDKCLGAIITIHKIGEYTIREYYPYAIIIGMRGERTTTVNIDYDTICYENEGITYLTLDAAIIGAICNKHKCSELTHGIARMIGLYNL